MKKVFLLLICVLTFLVPSQVNASENWKIENFQSNIILNETGVVSVTETISVDFSDVSKHGIFRDIPYIYKNQDGSNKYTEIKVLTVLREDKSEKYETSFLNGYIRIKIGEENVTITGRHDYKISYEAIGVLKSFENFDELYWNVTGNYWGVVIEKASATVVLPKNGINQTKCYQGIVGSAEPCAFTVDSPILANFATTRRLNIGEGVTLAIGYTKDLVPILQGNKPKEITDDLFSLASVGVFLSTVLLGLVLVITLWLHKGRDFWFRSRFLNDAQTKHEVKPVGGYETVVVEFTPPENLRPGEIGALLDENVSNIEITATIVDLANRGYLTIAEKPKKWLFGSVDYVFHQLDKDQSILLNYEKELLDKVFEKNATVKLSDLRNKFYTSVNGIKDRIYSNLVNKKFFAESPALVRLKYFFIGIAISVTGGVLVWFGFLQINSYIVSFGAGLVVVSLFAMVVSRSMPRKTAQGRAIYVRAKGYKMFVERAEKYRQQFFEKRNLFNEVLPYAIVFGVTEKFAKAFKEIGIEPEKPTWYSGNHTFNAAVFGASMASFSNSFSNTIASSPSSSGSGGGGSSGGGFGGGGGGSW